MKKMIFLLLLLVSQLFAEASKELEGWYVGAGFGRTYSLTTFMKDGTFSDDFVQGSGKFSMLNYLAYDFSYALSAGYQLNKVIAVEFDVVDYGNLQDDLYSQMPVSASINANLGYNFFENQFRPFVLLGLGYMDTKGNHNSLSNNLFVLHSGYGMEVYPKDLKGFGFRFLAQSDLSFKGEGRYLIESQNYQVDMLIRIYASYTLGVLYKF